MAHHGSGINRRISGDTVDSHDQQINVRDTLMQYAARIAHNVVGRVRMYIGDERGNLICCRVNGEKK